MQGDDVTGPLAWSPEKFEALRGSWERSAIARHVESMGAPLTSGGVWRWAKGAEPKAVHLLSTLTLVGDEPLREAARLILERLYDRLATAAEDG